MWMFRCSELSRTPYAGRELNADEERELACSDFDASWAGRVFRERSLGSLLQLRSATSMRKDASASGSCLPNSDSCSVTKGCSAGRAQDKAAPTLHEFSRLQLF